MADQDFNIKVVTTADTSGLRQTNAELDKLNQKQKDFLAGGPAQTGVEKFIASRQAAAAASTAAAGAEAEVPTSLTGTAVGLGTIIYVLTRAIRSWKEFNDEQDRMVDGMIKAEKQARALGESIVEMQDKAINARRLSTEPLEQSFIRLQLQMIRLKTEMSLLDLPRQGEEWKKLNAEVNADAASLRNVTSELQKQSAEREKAADKKARSDESFVKGAVEGTGPQVQAALRNEEAARRAELAGDQRSADLFRKSSEEIQRGMTGEQGQEFNQLKEEMARMNVSLQMILETFR